MKVGKVIGFGCLGCLGLVVVVIAAGYFALPDEYTVTRSTVVAAPPTTVFPLIDTPARWPEWDPWAEMDPDTKNTYEGPESGVGAKRTWVSDSQDVGSGTFTITKSVPHERIELKVEIFNYQMTSDTTFELERLEGGTKVTWTDHGDLEGGYKFFGLFMEPLLGEQFRTGLANLKELAESEVDAGDVLRDKADEILDDVLEGSDEEE